ncbi:hypothetical protein BQ8482_111674 [Mesorhizobium delmotii]|uniref:Uncharacterized protein n=1 Tax=Mesorhizobium delmotii TaxID=1631247 RepID=A0A2P9AF62_9HYPH|nr:hypothetical protein BQ8482_111674 [Mesorhizobium delmotii]
MVPCSLDLSHGPSKVHFKWGGCDEMDEVTEMAMPNCSTTARSRSRCSTISDNSIAAIHDYISVSHYSSYAKTVVH